MKVDELVPEIIVPDLTGFKVEIVVVVIDLKINTYFILLAEALCVIPCY